MFFWTQFAQKIGPYGPRPRWKQTFFSRNSKSRLSAFREFLFYQNIICFDWVMNLSLSWVMFSVKKSVISSKNCCVHPSLSKDMKGPMQIKRGKSYSLMLFCLKINCINIRTKKKSPYHQQARRHRALFQLYLHVILQMSRIYYRVIIMVRLWFADTRGLRWGITISCFESFS